MLEGAACGLGLLAAGTLHELGNCPLVGEIMVSWELGVGRPPPPCYACCPSAALHHLLQINSQSTSSFIHLAVEPRACNQGVTHPGPNLAHWIQPRVGPWQHPSRHREHLLRAGMAVWPCPAVAPTAHRLHERPSLAPLRTCLVVAR